MTGFGIAGTNAHVVLEEPPARPAELNIVRTRSAALLPLSAKSPEALRARATGIADLLESGAGPDLYDVCWTAATRRTSLEHRAAFVAGDRTAMVDSLRRYAEEAVAAAQGVVHSDVKPRICFICPGQGAQSVGMARQLMANEPAFLAALQRCDLAARSYVDWSIIEQLSAEPDTAEWRLDRDRCDPAGARCHRDCVRGSVALARRRARCCRRPQHGRSSGRVYRRCPRP